MNKVSKVTILTLGGAAALVLTLGAGSAFAHPGHGGGHRMGGFRHALAALDLTDQQRAAIRQKMESRRPHFQELRAQIQTNRQALRSVTAQPNADPASVGTAYLKVKASRSALRDEMKLAKADMESVLTEKQRAKLDGFITARRGGFGGMRRGSGPGVPDDERVD